MPPCTEFLAVAAAVAAGASLALSIFVIFKNRRLSRELLSLRALCTDLQRDAREMERDLTSKIYKNRDAAPGLITENMTIEAVLAASPSAREVLERFHIGGCSSCAVSTRETLRDAARGHGVELHSLLAALNSPAEGNCATRNPLELLPAAAHKNNRTGLELPSGSHDRSK